MQARRSIQSLRMAQAVRPNSAAFCPDDEASRTRLGGRIRSAATHTQATLGLGSCDEFRSRPSAGMGGQAHFRTADRIHHDHSQPCRLAGLHGRDIDYFVLRAASLADVSNPRRARNFIGYVQRIHARYRGLAGLRPAAGAWPVIIANGITLALAAGILTMKIVLGRGG